MKKILLTVVLILFALQNVSSLSILYKNKKHSYDSSEIYKTFSENKDLIYSYQNDNNEKSIKDIYISFYGSGEKIYEYYGHVGLCIEYTDEEKRYFDYGTFDFDAPNFIYNAVRGFMHYTLSESHYDFMKDSSKNSGRTYRKYRLLNLDDAQKKEIEQFLIFNSQDERNKYNYDFFYDNCSTRIRDILNNIYENKLKNKKDEHSISLRSSVASQTYTHKAVEMFYGFFGGTIFDKKLDGYDLMFIPEYLEGALLQNEDIELVEGHDWDIRIYTPVFYNPPQIKYFPLLYFVFCIVIFNLVCEAIYYTKKLKAVAAMKSVVNIFVLFFLVLSSLLMILASLYTRMYVMWYNQNLIFVNPLLIIFIAHYIKLIFLKDNNSVVLLEQKIFNVGLFFILLTCIAFILKIFLPYQDNVLYLFSFMLYYISLLPLRTFIKIYSK